ncbi:MAG: DNA polymerase I [Lysobacterales bacterium]
MSRPKLYLIDGSSFLYRAFHALPALTNQAGEPTGALFGVGNMIRKLLNDEQPAHVACVFDASGPTFRDEIFDQYKANRPPMPGELRAQIEPLLQLVGLLGLPLLRVSGVEADDVIGTLAKQGEAAGMDVVLVTGDKDLTQLVDDHVLWWNTMSNERLDAAGVQRKFGVGPQQIIDFLALTGDSVDNVPGVTKCGPKTAAKWLDQFGDLDAIMSRADEVGGKIGEYLREALSTLPMSRELVTIRTDCELPLGVDQLAPGAPDRDALIEFYRRYEFRQALRELLPDSADAPSAEVKAAAVAAAEAPPEDLSGPGEYTMVQDEAALEALRAALAGADLIAFDTETTSLDPLRAELVGLSFAVQPRQAWYLPVGHRYPGVPAQLPWERVCEVLGPLLRAEKPVKLAQHGKYDLHVLARHGVVLGGYAEDSMLESYVLDATAANHNMDALAKLYLRYDTIKYEEVAGKGAKQISFADVGLDEALAYAAEDADITLRLHRRLRPQLAAVPELDRVYRDIEMPLVPVLQRMEATGIVVDAPHLAKLSQEMGQQMLALVKQAHEVAGRHFNLDSPKQLKELLYDELGLKAKSKTPSGQPSTNEEALEEIAGEHPLPRIILDYRTLAKLKSTYSDKLPEQINPDTGRIHTSYHQAVAATGRLSSSDPNLQNIPIRTEQGRRIRQAFVAPAGWLLLSADYSQIELRIMAHLSGDEGLLEAFRQGRDIHRATAAEVAGKTLDAVSNEERRAAKAVNFGLIYGMGAVGLANNLGISRKEAQAYIDTYFARYPGVRRYMEQTRASAREQGYVETLFGRRLVLREINSPRWGLRAGAERAAINAPMQGTAADIIKRAMIDLDGWLQGQEKEIRMLLQVHDELVFEVREDRLEHYRKGIVERMQGAADLAVPLLVEAGSGANWDAAH